MPRSTTSTTSTGIDAARGPRRTRLAAPAPTGRDVPKDPPKAVDPAVQAAMEQVRPAPGFVLATLLLAGDRAELLGLPTDTTALLEAAFVRLVALHPSDDDLARDYPVGSVVVASLEGIAPLLMSHAFLLPADRIMGHVALEGLTPSHSLGFED
jgi:hypothetical protein